MGIEVMGTEVAGTEVAGTEVAGARATSRQLPVISRISPRGQV
jgi:hypothetical protein